MKKLSISILLLFVMILSITAVAAADDVTSDLAKSQITDDSAALAVDDNTDVLAAEGNFTQFQKAIDDGDDGVLISNPEYTMKSGEKAVVISKQVIISGGTIDAAGFGTIFNVTSAGKLTLSGVTLKNGNATNGGAIYNDGEISIQNTNTITKNNATLGGAIYNNGIINLVGATTFSDDTAKTGADIYNTKDGQISIGVGSSFAGSIYNEGTLTAGASTYGEIINNGTIDSITGSINGALTNYGTITTINSNNIAAPITNNGTITNIKGKTTAKVTNNNKIGTINATLADLENNGEIEAITGTVAALDNNGTITAINTITAKSITNEANATIGTIEKATITASLLNNGDITSIVNVTIGTTFSNKENATIGTIDKVTVTKDFGNYGDILGITNSTFKQNFRNRENATIGTIDKVTVEKATGNYGAITSITDSTFTSTFRNRENATIGTIDNVTFGAGFGNYGDIIAITNSTFKDIFNNNENATIGTIDNITVAKDITNLNVIGDINKVTATKLTNYGNITTISNSKITGEEGIQNGWADHGPYVELYNFVSYDGDSDYANVWSTGTVEIIDEDEPKFDDYKAVEVLSNPEYTDFVGQIFYVSAGAVADTGAKYRLYKYNDGDLEATDLYVTITSIPYEPEPTKVGKIGSIDNVTSYITVAENSTIGTIANSNIGVFNDGNITAITDSNITGIENYETGIIASITKANFISACLFNDGLISSVTGSTFNASYIDNAGNVTVSDSTFFNEANLIQNWEGNMIVSGCSFTNATDAAIANEANLTISNSVFTNNKRESAGGAAIFNYGKGNLKVADSTFENNVAGTYGGAINNQGVAVITGSTFKNNTASSEFKGASIWNAKNLTLSGNTINDTHADVANGKTGFITAVKITVTNNDTVYNYATPVNLTATLTDADGNWIYDMGAIDFVINGTVVGQPTAYNNTTGVYLLSVTLKGKENITNADQTVTANLTAKYVNATATVTDGTLKTIKGTFTELQYLIDNAGTNLVLPYDFAYNAEFDDVNLTKGVVINKQIVINGNGTTISGSDAARIFFVNVTDDSVVNFFNITFTKGNADNGAAIYANTSVRVYSSVFTDNVATANGAAIYDDVGAGKFVLLKDSKFTNNTATAIYVNSGNLNLINNTVNTKAAEIVNFNGTINVATINVTILANKTINATYNEAVTLNATITDENGNLINDPFFYFTISTDKFAAVFDETANIYTAETTLPYAPGEYEVNIKYNKTNGQTLKVATGLYNISKAAAVLTVDAPNVVAGENATITISLKGENGDNITGQNVTVVVNNVPYNVSITNGTGNITLPAFDLGTYNVFVNYAGDAYHNGSDVAVDFAVRTATKMTVTASDVTYDGATIAVTLTDGNGTPLTKFVTVTVDGKDYTVAVTNGAGSQVITGLAANKAYSVTATFAGDADYNEASATTTFSIAAATVTAENIKRGVNSPFDYYVTVTDANGNPIADKEITIYVNGTKYTAKTNATGIATVAAGLTVVNETATVYDVIVVNPDTGANITATTTIVPRIVVLSGDLTADYLENPPYIVQAFGDDGNPVGEGEIVTVVFSGYFYYMPTNATGHVVRTIGLAPGLYAVKAGYKDYNATATVFSVKQILTASSGTLKKTAKSYTLKATLKNTNGKAIAGKEVKLTFNGKTYKVKTNSKGVASYTIKSSVISKLTAGKTYKLTAKYVNDLTKGKYVGKIKVVKK